MVCGKPKFCTFILTHVYPEHIFVSFHVDSNCYVDCTFYDTAFISHMIVDGVHKHHCIDIFQRPFLPFFHNWQYLEYVSTSTIRDIHKLLRSCFQQAIKWEFMEKNPCIYATVPKHKTKKRDIWTAETLMYAMEVCEDDRLKLVMNLSFSCSLRISELLGLTWDCVDISEEAIEENRAYLFINKESQRVSKAALKELDAKDVLLVFPEKSKKNKTVRVLKTPKTDSGVTYKLKLNGGDIKAVQGGSGRSGCRITC